MLNTFEGLGLSEVECGRLLRIASLWRGSAMWERENLQCGRLRGLGPMER